MAAGTTVSTTEPIDDQPGLESLDGLLQHYGVNPETGLSDEAAAARLTQFGANRMKAAKSTGGWSIFFRQFQGTVVILLLVASAISYAMHEIIQAVAIMAAVVINAVIGFISEWRAKVSLEELEALAGPTARVLRAGHEKEIPAQGIVPGDIVILDVGARVPADLRLTDSAALSIDESSMSGESVAICKSASAEVGDEGDPLLALQGTLVVSGRGRGIVIATGDQTKLGHLGQLLTSTVSARTPLEDRLEELGKQLTVLISVLCVVLAAIGIWHKENPWLMIQTAIALAVAAIPEGMPVVATLALAVGTQRMVRAQALVRQLAAVETLGCTTVICSDKTGTLTENQMVVTELACDRRHLRMTGVGYEPVGEISEHGRPVCAIEDQILVELLRAAALCNDAKLENNPDEAGWHVHGDPTEGALIAAAGKVGLSQEQLILDYPRIGEIAFDLERKRMTTVHQKADASAVAYVKGSPESILKRAAFVHTNEGDSTIGSDEMAWFKRMNEELASRGLRVLAIARKNLEHIPSELLAAEIEKDLTLLGLVGMSDRPRQGVEEALQDCKKAGIKVIMVTGDHPTTARAIARDLNLLEARAAGDPILTGGELSKMNDAEMRLALRGATVLARVTPEMKLAVVRGLQADGEIVAMTGDGVNDAPALRQSNIGVAMGRSGTAMAREASSMVITDDNFTTVVKAVRQGRIIYANIRKSISYLLTASTASVLCVAGCVIFDLGMAFSPLQLLWLNLIMHIFPGLGIVLQRGSDDVMNIPPRSASEKLLSPGIERQIIIRSIICSITVLCALQLHTQLAGAAAKLSTVGLVTLSLTLLLQAWSWSRADKPLLPGKSAQINWPMLINIGISGALLFVAVYLPALQIVLQTSPLDPPEMLRIAVLSVLSAAIAEIVIRLLARRSPLQKTES
ncbi:MAG: cation-transporting P-type ATPase [Cyanobacteria bacterium SZAS LIN-3]|nr:cation-transporting P-type ATPase [Cyanobacteria bacterium SZAS LIN-3]